MLTMIAARHTMLLFFRATLMLFSKMPSDYYAMPCRAAAARAADTRCHVASYCRRHMLLPLLPMLR